MPLTTALLNTAPPAAEHYAIAFSGGLDSTVLLHLAHAAGLSPLSVVHVHHGLQTQADDWAQHALQQCQKLGLSLQILRVTVPADHPKGPEAAAREARYAAMAAALPAGGLLLTAHHAGDQAETVLLRLLRGTGIEGLAAMRPLTRLTAADASLQLWRPLLSVSREALLQYAQQHALVWIEDPHNQDPRYARSSLRQSVLPRLRALWPDADRELARAADHAAEAAELLQGLAMDMLQARQLPSGAISITALKNLSAAQRHLLLRHWLQRLGLPPAFAQTLRQLDTDVLAARGDGMPLLRWPGGEFRRYRDELFALAPLPALPADFECEWDGSTVLELPAKAGQLKAAARFEIPLRIRFARGGERIRLAGRAHSHALKALCQQTGVPPWLRTRLPLAWQGAQLVSIAGHWQADAAPSLHWQAPTWPGLPLSWQQNPIS